MDTPWGRAHYWILCKLIKSSETSPSAAAVPFLKIRSASAQILSLVGLFPTFQNNADLPTSCNQILAELSQKIKATMILFSPSHLIRLEKIMFWRDFNYKEKPYWELCSWQQSSEGGGGGELNQTYDYCYYTLKWIIRELLTHHR